MTELHTPWELHFDRDGVEDVAVILDADGEPLVTSRPFWLPRPDEPTPTTIAAVRLMRAAPLLLQALDELLQQTVDQDLKYGIGLSEGEETARIRAIAAIAVAAGHDADIDPDFDAESEEREWAVTELRYPRDHHEREGTTP